MLFVSIVAKVSLFIVRFGTSRIVSAMSFDLAEQRLLSKFDDWLGEKMARS